MKRDDADDTGRVMEQWDDGASQVLLPHDEEWEESEGDLESLGVFVLCGVAVFLVLWRQGLRRRGREAGNGAQGGPGVVRRAGDSGAGGDVNGGARTGELDDERASGAQGGPGAVRTAGESGTGAAGARAGGSGGERAHGAGGDAVREDRVERMENLIEINM